MAIDIIVENDEVVERDQQVVGLVRCDVRLRVGDSGLNHVGFDRTADG